MRTCLLLMLLVSTPLAHAQNAFWTNASGGLYTDISNWIPMAVPTAANNLAFQIPGDYRVDMLDNRSANRIDVLDNAGITFDLHNAAAGVGAVLAIATDVKVADSQLSIGDGLGTKRQVLDVDGDIDITGFASDPTRGTLTVNDDGTLFSGDAVLGNGSGRFGWARVTGTDAEWNMSGQSLSIGSTAGNGGGGQLIVENGGEFSAHFIEIGVSPLSPDQSDRGELIVSGIGGDGLPSTVNLTGRLNVGDENDSRGELTVTSGAQMAVGEVRVGHFLGGLGLIAVSGTDGLGNPTTWQMENIFIDETNATNGIRFLDGAQISTAGNAGIARGEIVLSGVAAVGATPTRWTIGGKLQVAVTNSDIEVENGAQLQAAALDLAVGASTIGSLRLRDSTADKVSMLTIAGDALVGGTETFDGGVAHFELGLNTKTRIGGLLKIWDDAFVPLRGQLHAGEIDILDAVAGAFPLISGELSFDEFNGDLLLENVVLSPGEVTVAASLAGDYEQDASATLRMDINGPGAGTEYDQLTISGNAQLDGELQLTLGSGYTPNPSDVFTVLGATLLTGNFDNVGSGQRLYTSDGKGSFVVNYGIGSGFDKDLIVLSDFEAADTFPGDYDGNERVDGSDFLLWQRNDGTPGGLTSWQTNYGMQAPALTTATSIPEPTSLILFAAVPCFLPRWRSGRSQPLPTGEKA